MDCQIQELGGIGWKLYILRGSGRDLTIDDETALGLLRFGRNCRLHPSLARGRSDRKIIPPASMYILTLYRFLTAKGSADRPVYKFQRTK